MEYEEWKQRKESEELGGKLIIANWLLKRGVYEAIRVTGNQLGHAISRALFRAYEVTDRFEFAHERNVPLRSWEDSFLVEAEPSHLPEQYCYMAQEEWEREKSLREAWEKKSLWGYVSFWFKRKFKLLEDIDS